MIVSPETLRAACRVLDRQRGFIAAHGKEQKAYYRGMLEILELIISGRYTDPKSYIDSGPDGHIVILGGEPLC